MHTFRHPEKYQLALASIYASIFNNKPKELNTIYVLVRILSTTLVKTIIHSLSKQPTHAEVAHY